LFSHSPDNYSADTILAANITLQVAACCRRLTLEAVMPFERFRASLILSLLLLVVTSTQAAEQLKKTVHQYALTSANDFPQRDPQDWRLLGSNDGGKTWTTLDTRKNEVFRERHQRRVFSVARPAAFETYRLQIELVRDPKVANSVQLAEIELLGGPGADNDPTPIFADRITAQGDNLPAETVVKLFDGRVETKWLDKPQNRTTCASWVQWQYAAPDKTVVTNISQLRTLRSRANDGFQVQIDAVMVGRTGREGEWSIADATDSFEISGLSDEKQLGPGQPITLTGVSQWREGRVGVGASTVQFRGPPGSGTPETMLVGQQISARENLKWVEVEGEVRYRRMGNGEISFDVHDEGASLRVYWRGAEEALVLPPSGTRVTVRGLCRGAFNDQGHWVVASLWAAGPEAVNLTGTLNRSAGPAGVVAPVSGALPGTGPLTKIEQLRRLSPEQLNRRPQVKIRGVVTELVGAFMQDDTAGIEVAFQGDEGRKITEPGLFIEVEGWGGVGDVGNPVISADRVTVLGRGKLPEPQRMSLSLLLSGRTDAQWIEMEGVVRSTDGAHLLMICYGREVTASVGAGAAGLVKGLVDAAVRVRGVGVTALDDQGRIQGTHLLIPSLEHVDVVEAPVDPEALPVRPIGSLLGLSGPRESYHRVKVEGVVTLQENQKLFLQDESGGALAIFKEDVMLDARFGRSRWLFWRTQQTNVVGRVHPKFAPGDRVQVVGFPETRSYSPALTEVTVTKLGSEVPVPTYQATVNGVNDGRADSRLVSVEGVLLGRNTIGAHEVMALEWHERTLQVLVPVKAAAALALVPGSRLRVTGVCQVESTPYAELGLRVATVRILTRTAADLVVLSRPPWWTVKRALTVMGAMAFVILAALIWIKQLRKQVEERSQQLATEIQLREQTERRSALEQERARIAKDLHDDLGANLAQIVFLSQRVDGGRHDLNEVDRWFRLIPATARKTIQSLDEIVWAINPRHDLVESLANYLSQFAQEHLTLAGVRCVLDVPMVLPEINVSAEVRHNLVLAAREAIHNVTTHAAATEAQVTLTLDDAALTVAIRDNGRGFDSTQASGDGNGLSNMRRRLEDIGGRMELETSPGGGTTVRFVVPRHLLHGRVIGAVQPGKAS
jgi:signal transduction histidine kinase